ncbi:ExbD/TolR family protein [Endothiovibrio diazotrophicus]
MNFRSPRREEPEINLTPLIDVVFLMLIFFMISTTFNREAEMSIQLPEASAEPAERRDDTLELVINREGRYFIGEQEVVNRELETLRDALRAVAGEKAAERPLVISADAEAPYQAVIRAMDAAGQLGISAISLTTKSTGEP